MTSASTAALNLPLFYKTPQPLSAAAHGGLKLRGGDCAFCADTAYVPIVTNEFALAARDYPILFSADQGSPLALVGLKRNNLFVNDAQWNPDAYMPAYVRRYPFTTARLDNGQGFALVIDAAYPGLVNVGAEGEGAALFDGETPSAFTKQALEFCERFHADAFVTEAFSKALLEQDLLVDRRADVTLPDGAKHAVHGFKIVDAARFAALDDKTVVEWHRKGWAAAVHFHFASLDRFQNLLKLQGQQASAQPQGV